MSTVLVIDDTYQNRKVNVNSLNKRLYEVKEKVTNNISEYIIKRYSDNKYITPIKVEVKETTNDYVDDDKPYFKEDYNIYIKINGIEYRYGIDELNNEYIITEDLITKGRYSGNNDEFCKNPDFYPSLIKKEEKEKKQEPTSLIIKIAIPLVLSIILLLGYWTTNKYKAGDTTFLNYFKNGMTVFMIPTGMIMLVSFVIMVIYNSSNNTSNWCFDPYHKNSLKKKRASERGTYISMVLIVSALIQGVMGLMGAESSLLLFMYGFILAAVFGYIGDKVIGTDEGYSLYNKNKIDALKYAMGSLVEPAFFRYIITVFLDMFISTPIQMALTYLFKNYISSLTNKRTGIDFLDSGVLSGVTSAIGSQFGNVLQSLVAVLTFLAYTNDTRFLWAYPDKTLLKEEKLPVPTIKLATSISAVLFLVANYPKLNDTIQSTTIDGMLPGNPMGDTFVKKLIFVILTVILLTMGSKGILYNIESESQYKVTKKIKYNKQTGKYEVINDVENISNKLDTAKEIKSKWKSGLIMFTLLLGLGFTLPFMGSNTASITVKGITLIIPLIISIYIYILISTDKK